MATHHSELVYHSRDPADVDTFIHHRYKQSVRVFVAPVERCALWVTHPDGGLFPYIGVKLTQRTTVQPERGRLKPLTYWLFIMPLLQLYHPHTGH